MGRAKKKRKAKAKAKRYKQISLGKAVRFVLSNSPKKYQGCCNRYSYQSNIHNLIYVGASFVNDKFQNCTITSCNFRNATLTDIYFAHCNLKGTSFKNVALTNVTFFDCKMQSANFENAIMNNVTFIRMNLNTIRNLPDEGYNIVNSYPKIDNEKLLFNALLLSNHNSFYKYHVLNISKTKVNNWYLQLLLTHYENDEDVSRGLYALNIRKDRRGFITIASYMRFLDRYLKI